MRCWIDESLFEIRTHRFLKWWFVAFWNENSWLCEMRTHRFLKWRLIPFFPWYITLYNIYDQRWMSILYEPDYMQENFSSMWKNPKTVRWSTGSRTWWKLWMKDQVLDENKVCALSRFIIQFICHFFGRCFRIFSYRWNNFLACYQVHTKSIFNDDCIEKE
jgi:hypothetical protein